MAVSFRGRAPNLSGLDRVNRSQWRKQVSVSVFERVRAIASDILGVPAERITPDSSPESIEKWDSTQHLNLILALEDTFQLQFAPEEMDQMQSIAQITKVVESKLQSR